MRNAGIKPEQKVPTADLTVGPASLLAPTPKEERVVPVFAIFDNDNQRDGDEMLHIFG